MKYFNDGDILLSDFDGVFLDSQSRFLQVMKDEKDFDKWMKFLNEINWKKFLRECNLIPGALETFTELQSLKILRGFITTIHSFEEGQEKCNLLRDLGMTVPVHFALPKQDKSEVYIPNSKVVLLDDMEKNCNNWEENHGKSILYSPTKEIHGKKYVKSLTELLK